MRRVISWFVMGSLAACQVGRDFRRPDYKAPASFHAFEAPSQGPQDLARWWEQFHDPLLTKRVQTALDHNTDMQAAEARVRAARALALSQRGGLWPTAEALGSWLLQSDRASPGPFLSNATTSIPVDVPAVRWDLDIFGGTQRGLEATEAAALGAKWRAWGVRVSLAAETAKQEILARGLAERLRIAEANVAAQKELEKLAQSRFDAGLDTQAPVVRARAQWALMRATLPPLREAMAGALNRLAVLMGQAPGLLKVEAQVIPLAPLPPPGLPLQTLRRRPDVALAEAALHEATARIGVEEAELYPHFSLSSGIHASVGSPDDLLRGDSYTFSIGPSMRWRLFDRVSIKQRMKMAGANAQAALHDFDGTVLNALEEVENALNAVVQGNDRVAKLAAAEQEAMVSVALSRDLYEKGLGDFSAVLTDRQQLFAVQDALAEARTRQALAGVGMYQAMGGGWDETQAPKEKR